MISLFLAAVLQTESNWNGLSQTLQGTAGAHIYRIAIACQNFEPRGRRVTWRRSDGLYYPAVDGRRTWGIDGQSREDTRRESAAQFLKKRTTEIRRFDVVVDGVRWPIPTSLTFDLLNLDRNDASSHDYGQAWLSRDGTRLVLKQAGSDGGGGYEAYFIMRRRVTERRVYIESILAETRRVRSGVKR